MVHPQNILTRRIAAAFEADGCDPETAWDIGFHMTDWMDDIAEIQGVFANATELTDDELQAAIFKFLAHVPDHLNAAKRLVGFGPIVDVFGVGLFDPDEDEGADGEGN
jgi:hypothetical protein